MKRKTVWGLGVLAMLFVAAVNAQDFPNKSVRLVVPAPPGGGLDLIARVVGQKMNDGLKQIVLADNRPGANDVIGTNIVAKAAPDGYTMLLAAAGEIAVLPHLQKSPYNVDKDFAPLSLAVIIPLILVVHPTAPAMTVQELVSLAKARPGQITYASAGTGGAQHLAGELLKITAKVDLVHVPYKGGGPAIVDLVGGYVSMLFSELPDVKSQLTGVGAAVVGFSVEELAGFVRAESKKFAWLVKESGAKGTD